MSQLSEQDLKRLEKLLGLLSSDHAGERATAGQMAWKFIKERGLSWPEILRPKVPSVSARRSSRSSPAKPTTWREVVARCPRLNDDLDVLTDWEWRFLVAPPRRRFPPT